MDSYIGFHNGAGAADEDYEKGNMGYNGCHDGHGKEYCLGYKAGYDTDANALR